MRHRPLNLSLLLAVAACQPETPLAPVAKTDHAAATATSAPAHLLQTQQDALQSAKAIQQQMDQQSKEREKALDAATGQ